ncbi:hypothetical protein FHT00_000272 [Sphingomonas insulae]|uniref:DUF2501 domain-containing protein n=1 Tax=Sphingomonas insulae TaxID=424800 RepID=A0ABP3T6Y7_9SPHN|nr:DUF2501 domain-containing protein [Sphingomonas insulae]NIJ28344.1 hypothetical protein [Sphingomonas insulae]
MKVILAAALLLPTAALAQTATTAPLPAPAPATSQAGGLLGRAGGLLGGGLPQVGSIGAGNAAGLLGYCVKNKLLGVVDSAGGATATNGTNSGAAGILGRLTGKPGVATSPGYAAGQSGRVLGGGGQSLSLDSLRGQVKSQVCNVVLKRAQSFL